VSIIWYFPVRDVLIGGVLYSTVFIALRLTKLFCSCLWYFSNSSSSFL